MLRRRMSGTQCYLGARTPAPKAILIASGRVPNMHLLHGLKAQIERRTRIAERGANAENA
jgi:hypothetical protein